MKPPKELGLEWDFFLPQVNDRFVHPNAIMRAPSVTFSMRMKDLIDTKIWRRTRIEIPGGKYIPYSSFFPLLVTDKFFSKRFNAWDVNVSIKLVGKKLNLTPNEKKEVRELDTFYRWLKKKYDWLKLPTETIKEIYLTWKKL